ncbi:MAG: hypothetical protein FWD14_00780 [Treponema sp.]|nr:hypothetical protein [Treponema sp.]
MKRSGFIAVLILALAAASLGLVGCATPIVSAGEAIDAVGISQSGMIQYYSGATFELILMRAKNNQTDTTAVVRRGVPTYTREKIVIPANRPCVVVRQETTEDGRLILHVAFEKDENLTLSFIQSSNELSYFTTFDMLFEGDSDIPVVKYGEEYYTVRSYNVIRGAYGIAVGQAAARPYLGIRENVRVRVIRTTSGRKL